MRQILTHGVVAVACLCTGFLFQGFTNKDTAKDAASSLRQTNNALSAVKSTKLADAIDQPADQENTDSLTLDGNDNTATQFDTVAELPILDTGSDIAINGSGSIPTTSLDLLANANLEEMLQTGEIDLVAAAFSEWFSGRDNPGKEIVDFLLSEENSSEEKHVLEYLLGSSTAMRTIDGLDLSVVEQLGLAAPEDAELWENTLNTVRITSSEARTELLNTLPNITNDKIISASLMAIRPDFLAPSERSQLLSEMSIYTDSESEDVRSAAILSLSQWSAQGYAYVVEDMLANGTQQEKNAALLATGSGKFWSEQIEHETLFALSDESAPMELRMNAFSVLSNRALDDGSYAEVHRFYEQYVRPLGNQP